MWGIGSIRSIHPLIIIKMTKSFPFIIIDVLIDEIEESWNDSFKKEYGIIQVNSIQSIKDGIEEMKIFFKDEESKDIFVEEFDYCV
jgi:hypothetical protein